MNLVCLQRIYPSSVGEEEQSVVGVHNHQVQHGIVFSSTHADDAFATAVLSAEGIGRHSFHVALLAEGDDRVFVGDERLVGLVGELGIVDHGPARVVESLF